MSTQDVQPSVKIESPKRKFSGRMVSVLTVTGVALSLFTIITMGFYPVDPLLQRATFLYLSTIMAFTLWPALSKSNKKRVSVVDILFILLSTLAWVYTLLNFEGINERAGMLPTRPDVIMGVLLILVCLEMARRTMGFALPTLGLIMIIYALAGNYLPGMLRHPGFSIERTVSYIYSNNGIFGVPLAVTVSYVFVFVLFGAVMETIGGGKVMMDLAMAIAGRYRGGAAKIAVVGSSFFGMINGSPVANATAVGTFTIPLMKKNGYKPVFAGAVEAVSSTGGQILPPVMGASVFIMVELLNVPYGTIAIAATIPAILYYLAVFWMVDLEAQRLGLHRLPNDQVPRLVSVLKNGGHLLIPVIVLGFVLIVVQLSPLRAGLWGVASCVIVSFFRKESRLNIQKLITALKVGAEGTIMVTAAVAVAGAIVGVFDMTGLGLNMANILLGYSYGIPILTMILSMIVLLILGIGMPTTGSYIIGATIIAPALIKLGIIPLAAHLFVLYFANISNITPPVALAAYASSGLAGANPMAVGVQAFKLGISGFIIPYMVVFGNQLMLRGSIEDILVAITTATLGTLSLGSAIQGYFRGELKLWMRAMLLAGAFLLIKPGFYTDLIGLGLLLFIVIVRFNKKFNPTETVGIASSKSE